ncbi:MAG: Fe-S oxidoreductase [Planctomycetota bacterium]
MSDLSRNAVNPDRPYLVLRELEAALGGKTASILTIFLTASECPVGCSMCDLWRNTTIAPTAKGAIPRQIAWAMNDRDSPVSSVETGPIVYDGEDPSASRFRTRSRRALNLESVVKLYNSGNFFDPRSIPPVDYLAIAEQVQRFDRVVVENHPRFGGKRLNRFRALIHGDLEVAVGLETVQPRWLARMKKGMTRDDFDRYAETLQRSGVRLRVFLIVGVPGVGVSESKRWAMLSARHAIMRGAVHVALIPCRTGNGWSESGWNANLPDINASVLCDIQQELIRWADGHAVVTVDTWDMNDGGKERRLARQQIERLNEVQGNS